MTQTQTQHRGQLVAAVALVVTGVAVAITAMAVGWVSSRGDRAGFFHTDTGRLESAGYAITSDVADRGRSYEHVPSSVEGIATLRVQATPVDDRHPIFVGVAHAHDVERYLADVAHDTVTDIEDDPFAATSHAVDGAAHPAAPTAQDFWIASVSGTSRQDVRWNADVADWVVVVMNADASPHVAIDTNVGLRIGYLVPVALVLGALAIALVTIGSVLAVRARR